jgi:hypothetical protein
VPFFAVSGLRVQAGALRSGGQRKLALPESGPDPTDTAGALAAFLARRRELSGERRLVLAVVTATLEDLRRYPITSKPYATAWRWLMSDDERWPCAFRSCCATLDLDADAVRTRLRATLAAREPAPPSRPMQTFPAPRGRPPVLLCRVAS